jgi:hypothetical protein
MPREMLEETANVLRDSRFMKILNNASLQLAQMLMPREISTESANAKLDSRFTQDRLSAVKSSALMRTPIEESLMVNVFARMDLRSTRDPQLAKEDAPIRMPSELERRVLARVLRDSRDTTTSPESVPRLSALIPKLTELELSLPVFVLTDSKDTLLLESSVSIRPVKTLML